MDEHDVKNLVTLFENMYTEKPQMTQNVAGDEIYKLWKMVHRTDGPAIVSKNGKKEFWIYGHKYGDDVAAWAVAALQWEHTSVTQDNIDAKIAQVMQHDLFD